MAMTPAQRSAAAHKAAATRRARQAAGHGPHVNPAAHARPRNPAGNPRPAAPAATPKPTQAFATPKPTIHGQKLIALAALEDVVMVALASLPAKAIGDETRKAWDQYQKLKAMALGTSHTTALTTAQQTEAATALRLATVALVKLAF